MENSGIHEEEKKQLIEEIIKRAAAYTKDWRFHMENPDIGTALALLYADMMKETLVSYKGLLKRYQMYFYRLLGENCLPAEKARGYVSFDTVNEEVPGARVPAGTRIYGDRQGENISFETEDEVYVSPARMKEIYYVSGSADYISKPLTFPISEKKLCNQQSHLVYIGHPFLFAVFQKGEILIDFHTVLKEENKKMKELLLNQVTWSYYSKDGYVEIPSVRYMEGRIFLNKDQMLPPFAKTELQGKYSYWIRMDIKKLNPEEQIIFNEISMAAKGSYLEPEIIYDGNAELDKEGFFPFGEDPYPFAELYLANEEVFSKKGALVNIQFDLEYVKHSNGLKLPEMPVKWRNIMHRSELKKADSCEIHVESVIWEYYNGNGWERIAETKCYQNMFMPEQSGGMVEFRCPEDISSILLAGKERYCIRIRVLKVTNPYEMEGIYVVPRIKNLFLHYRYDAVDIYPRYAYAINQLDVKELSCRGECVPFYNRFPNKEMLYLSFSKPLGEEGIRLLFLLEKGNPNNRHQYRYEYYGKEGFQALKAEDQTFQLSRSGILTLCEEHPFKEKEFFGTKGYWLRIVWETDPKGKIHLPSVREVHMNSTAVKALEESGELGNLPAFALHTMERNIGYINKVTNYEAITGGCNEEQTKQAEKRIAASFRHQKRAVTTKDFEDIVYSEMRSILQIRCFNGRDEKGEKAPGHITLVVLLEKEAQMYFDTIKEDIYKCLEPYMDCRLYKEGRIHIVEPEWYSIEVYMTAAANERVKRHLLKEKICRQLQAFIHPVTGNFGGTGWRIGTVPSALQIQNACNQMEEIFYIEHISLREEYPPGIYALGIGGEHEIEIITE
ncbi:MAG: baseplate J/gp47 family protein [Lachnospiraceae bacterium]|nr:baseplate J/gp47 family protein [Lachnospiraceae bacterium]